MIRGGLFHSAQAVGVLIAGIAISLLFAWVVFLLATGRLRALQVVDATTDELRHQALHDALTGLPNRALLNDRIDRLLAHSHRTGTTAVLLYVDLDGFKNINDTLGHTVGDRVLQAVAGRLSSGLPDADTIGRLGGDEFLVLVRGGMIDDAPEYVAERLLELIRQPLEIEGTSAPIAVTASVGVAVGGQAPQTYGELLRQADVALYEAKAAGKNCYVTFRPEMGTDLRRRHELDFDLRGALERGEFHLVYQPIYRLEDLTVVGVEALLRWRHRTFGMIAPGEFIPLLESSGHIMEVGRWVLGEATRQMVRWRRGGRELAVAVNVSGRQLDRDVIVEHVREALEVSGLEPAALTIEVTETALMHSVDATAGRLRDLKNLGVRIAIDDFGTGYSSMAYVQRLPIDYLKIDRTFVDAIGRSREADALVHTLVQLGRDLRLTTIAEGVEKASQLERLRAEQVDQVQGFLLSEPLTRDQLEDLLPVSAQHGGQGRGRPAP